MIKDTLKQYQGQFIAIKTKGGNYFGGLLDAIDDDHIVLKNRDAFTKKYGNTKTMIAMDDISSVLFDYNQISDKPQYEEPFIADEDLIDDRKNERRQKLVKLPK